MYMPSGTIKLFYTQKSVLHDQAEEIADALSAYADRLQGGITEDNCASAFNDSKRIRVQISELSYLLDTVSKELEALEKRAILIHVSGTIQGEDLH